MFYLDWLSESLEWWGYKLWIFMSDLEPIEWVEPPEYYLKLFLYASPIIFLHLVIFIWRGFRSRRKKQQLQNRYKIVKHSYICPHCGYAPEYPPASGTYFCAKCGKMSRINH